MTEAERIDILKLIEELVTMRFEVLFYKDDLGYHCEILKNDLYVLSIFAITIDQLASGVKDLLTQVKKLNQ